MHIRVDSIMLIEEPHSSAPHTIIEFENGKRLAVVETAGQLLHNILTAKGE